MLGLPSLLWIFEKMFHFILGSWFYLVFFCGAIKLTGPFVVMIYAMIMGDMYTFSIIYIIFLFGFTQAFFYLLKSANVSFLRIFIFVRGHSKTTLANFGPDWHI